MTTPRPVISAYCLATILLLGNTAAFALDSSSTIDSEAVSLNALEADAQRRCQNYNPLKNPYFGDLHVHSTYSLDANTQGTLITPHQSYRFARGEKLDIQPYDEEGNSLRSAQLARPLDFAAVTDHAELLGEVEVCTNPNYLEYNAPECLFYREQPANAFLLFNLMAVGLFDISQTEASDYPLINELPLIGADGNIPRMPFCGVNGRTCLEAAKTPWGDIQAAAESFYDQSESCNFTTFVAYEWTGAPQSNNLHRNVIFRSSVVPKLPPAFQEYPEPENLWTVLDELCLLDEGCDVLTIPHNSNLSGGLMFRTVDKNGDPYDKKIAQARQDNEPLAEIYQHKGQSECLGTTGAGMQDELCGFELLPYNNFTADRAGGLGTGEPLEQDFLREALKEGLRLEGEIGANPFKYGFIGSSDTHLGTSGLTAEENYPGHGGAGAAASNEVPDGLTDLIEYSPGGLAVAWAEQNTRSSLFAALRRKEVYGTSGMRPIVRSFGGWKLPPGMCSSEQFANIGYNNGVPMGGDLPAAPNDASSPQMAIWALADPGAGALQRIQIIKGWTDAKGHKQEAVYEVAGNPNNGAGVDLNTCTPTGQGYAQLCTVWQDPDFDPGQRAFYYARVVDNPSCRWSARQCLKAGISCENPDEVPEQWSDCCNADYPKTIQERAWTSPIWYSPEG